MLKPSPIFFGDTQIGSGWLRLLPPGWSGLSNHPARWVGKRTLARHLLLATTRGRHFSPYSSNNLSQWTSTSATASHFALERPTCSDKYPKAEHHQQARRDCQEGPTDTQPKLRMVIRHIHQQPRQDRRTPLVHVQCMHQMDYELGRDCLMTFPQRPDSCVQDQLQVHFQTMSYQCGNGSNHWDWNPPHDATIELWQKALPVQMGHHLWDNLQLSNAILHNEAWTPMTCLLWTNIWFLSRHSLMMTSILVKALSWLLTFLSTPMGCTIST